MKRHLAMLMSCLLACGFATADAMPPEGDSILTGTVLEVQNVDNYTYLLLQTSDGEMWAAVQRASVHVGAHVEIAGVNVMQYFTSPTLHRTFERIAFGSLVDLSARAAPHDFAAVHAGAGKSADVRDIAVQKADAPNAYTVADLASEAADLDGRSVTVRGQVVKYTPDVLGQNWIHLRDGSGSATDGSNDVLVVTADSAAVGDVVVAKGTVHTDRDLGSGYRYKFLIEAATLHK